MKGKRLLGTVALVVGGLGCMMPARGCAGGGGNVCPGGGTDCLEKQWDPPSTLDTATVDTHTPTVAISSNGDALALWNQDTGSRLQLLASHYAPESGWGTAQPVEADDSHGSAYSQDVAMDDAGNAIAVWQYEDRTTWTARYEPDTGWGAPEALEDDDGDAVRPRVAMNGAGDAMAVWPEVLFQYDPSTGLMGDAYVWAQRYALGTGWASPEIIAAGNYDTGYADVRAPDVGLDSAGNAVAVFEQAGQLSYFVASQLNMPGSAWTAPEPLEPLIAYETGNPQIAVNGAGSAVAVWPGYAESYAAYYQPGTGWSPGVLLHDFFDSEAAIGGDGTVLTVWAAGSIMAERFVPDGGWGTAESIESATSGSSAPQVAMDDLGNGTAIWIGTPSADGGAGGPAQLMFDTFEPASGWGNPQVVHTAADAGTMRDTALASSAQGTSVAAWIEVENGTGHVWASIRH